MTGFHPSANSIVFHFIILVLATLLFSCDSGPSGPPPPTGEQYIVNASIVVNPSGYAPLTAELTLTTNRPLIVEIFVPGRRSNAGDIRHRFPELATSHVLPVLGLYSSTENEVHLLFYDESGALLGETTRTIETEPLVAGMPVVSVQVNRQGYKPGTNLISYFGNTGDFLPMTPVVTDSEGDIRWFADFEGHPILGSLFYDAGVERLANGDLFFGDGSSERIASIDMLGNVTNQWPIPGYGFHHHVMEMVPDGNLLATVNKRGLPTIEDHIIEIDRASGDIVQEWDLRQSLDDSRKTWTNNLRDWFHANGLAYDVQKDAIIVSGRVQGTVKLTRTNDVIWIMAPHRGWLTAGNGVDLNTKLLTPLDAGGNPITDPDILDGSTNHPDFEWAWYQHAPEILPNGDLLLFDNGDNRNFGNSPNYSRAVVYRIDDDNMTVQQIWSYGKQRGGETYSSIVSDVDYHITEDNIFFMPGTVFDGIGALGRMVEIDVSSRTVLYEATVRLPEGQSGITFHRVERLPLYAPNN